MSQQQKITYHELFLDISMFEHALLPKKFSQEAKNNSFVTLCVSHIKNY